MLDLPKRKLIKGRKRKNIIEKTKEKMGREVKRKIRTKIISFMK